MTSYKIKITYTTGNSLGQKSTTEDLELTWENLDNAKDNLNRIKEHYEMHLKLYGLPYNKTQSILSEHSDKDWFVNKLQLYNIDTQCVIDESDKHKCKEQDLKYIHNSHDAEYYLRLKADNGNYMQLSAFWIGYFESLQKAEINTNDEDLEIEF